MSKSTIEEKRDLVIRETNTAQSEFLTFLDQIDAAHATEIRFDSPMHGDIDFSVLRDRGFKHIVTIIFDEPGEVTNLRNIPEGVAYIDCQNQLLTSLDSLPTSIEEIDITNNSIKKFDARTTPKLRSLYIANNVLSQLVNLPDTLVTLECENNQLRRLDLSNTRSLVSLHCSNNPLLMLEHVPPTLTDLLMENNPLLEIDRSDPTSGRGGKQEAAADKRYDYLESIYEYFRLKNEYEVKLHKLKRTAFEKQENKRAGKRSARAVRAPCISCKRRVGTVFTMKDQMYTAVCGDKDKPCNLNIQIFNGYYLNATDLLNIYRTDIANIQEKVIVQKLKTLFNYVGERTAVDKFKAELEEYNQSNQMYQDLLKHHMEVYDNPDTAAQLARKNQEMYRVRGDIDRMISEYRKTGNRDILTSAIEMQIRDLIPILHNIRLLKYDSMTMEADPDDVVSTLIQEKIAPHKRDFTFSEKHRVIKFVYTPVN